MSKGGWVVLGLMEEAQSCLLLAVTSNDLRELLPSWLPRGTAACADVLRGAWSTTWLPRGQYYCKSPPPVAIRTSKASLVHRANRQQRKCVGDKGRELRQRTVQGAWCVLTGSAAPVQLLPRSQAGLQALGRTARARLHARSATTTSEAGAGGGVGGAATCCTQCCRCWHAQAHAHAQARMHARGPTFTPQRGL